MQRALDLAPGAPTPSFIEAGIAGSCTPILPGSAAQGVPPKRLLLVSAIRNRKDSGMGRWSYEVARALANLGAEPTLWFLDDFPGWVWGDKWSSLTFPWLLSRRIIREHARFDALLVHEYSGLWYAHRRKRQPHLPPMTLVCHNVASKLFGQMAHARRAGFASIPFSTRIKTPLVRLSQSDGAIRNADHVVCLSREDLAYVTSRLGRHAANTTLITNGGGEDPPRGASPPLAGQNLLFVGAWVDVKGRRLLPRIWRQVREQIPAASLTLAATGMDQRACAAGFAPADRTSVHTVPRIKDRSHLAELLRQHDALILPSISEGSPLVLIEAMASGLPVVATAAGGIPDLIEHGRHGLLFQTLDSTTAARQVVLVLREKALARELARQATERARTYTWNRTAQGLLEAVSKTCAVGHGESRR